AVLENGGLLLDPLDAGDQVVALDDAAEPAEERFGFLGRHRLVGAEGVVRRKWSADCADHLRAGAIWRELLGSDANRDEDFRGPCAVVRRSDDAAARQSSCQAFGLSAWSDDSNPGPARHACHLTLRTSDPLNLCIKAYL